MKTLLKPKYQYLLIPLTFIYGCVISAINYILWKDVNKAGRTLLLGFGIGAVFYLFVPFLLTLLFKVPNVLETRYSLVYFYLVSIPASIYFIKEQQRYFRH